MNADCPRLVIAGTHSGVGKTSLSLALARLFARQGLRVQTFKVGPDFLDPTYLAMASGRTCYNLDGWMTSRPYVRRLFARASAGTDVAVIEGVMGLFDGASPCGLEGSTAQIAQWLDAPVILVAGAHGAARSLAATVRGFAEFEPGVRVAGVIANQGGSERHAQWLRASLAGASAPPLVGLLPRGALPTLPSRHLGLVAADHAQLTPATIDDLADACARHLDVARLLELARSAGALEAGFPEEQTTPANRLRLGIARDEAFHFYYADNLESLHEEGAELVNFSPLADRRLPGDLDALYFGGGYPEAHAEQLAANSAMLADVRAFADSGRPIYGECGGMMYLGRSLTTLQDRRFPLAGVLPLETAMLPRLKQLGYAEVTWAADTLWGRVGQVARGHEFHYSEVTAEDEAAGAWQRAYTVAGRRSPPIAAGLTNGPVLAGYVHLHWASRPDAVRHFLACRGERS